MHQIVITPSAKRSLKRLPADIQAIILQETEELKHNPYAGERLSGSLNFLYSLHFKRNNVHHRVAYSIDTNRHLVIIHLTGPRENFYDRLKRLW